MLCCCVMGELFGLVVVVGCEVLDFGFVVEVVDGEDVFVVVVEFVFVVVFVGWLW